MVSNFVQVVLTAVLLWPSLSSLLTPSLLQVDAAESLMSLLSRLKLAHVLHDKAGQSLRQSQGMAPQP